MRINTLEEKKENKWSDGRMEMESWLEQREVRAVIGGVGEEMRSEEEKEKKRTEES